MWTEDLAGLPAEMGASWIHGVSGNPLTSIAGRAGVDLVPFGYGYGFTSASQRASGRAGARQLAASLDSVGRRSGNPVTTPLSDLLPRRRTPGLQWAINSEISQEYGADPEALSVFATEEGESIRGGDALLAGSYQQMIAGAAGELPLRLGTVVESIEYGGGRVRLVESGGGRTDADLVVVTVRSAS